MAAIFNGRHFGVLHGFSSGFPLESYLLPSTMTMHTTLHELHWGSTMQQQMQFALLINEIREKSEILRLLQNCAEPLRFRDKCIKTKMFPLHTSFQRKKRKSNSDH